MGSTRLLPPSFTKPHMKSNKTFLKVSTARGNRLASFKPGDCKSGRSAVRAKKLKSQANSRLVLRSSRREEESEEPLPLQILYKAVGPKKTKSTSPRIQ